MKKIWITCTFISLLLLFFGCSQKKLDNPYFENTSENTFEEAHGLFNEYMTRVRGTLEEYFPRVYQDEVMYFEEGYINAQLSSKDRIYRHELFNYHLSDDRSYMRYSQLYYLTDNTFFGGLSGIISECDTITEGENCVETRQLADPSLLKSGLTFYMEGNELYMEFMFSVNVNTLYHYAFHFYEDEFMDDTMEMTLQIYNTSESIFETNSYTKLVFGKSLEESFCNHCDINDSFEGSLEYLYAKFKEKPYQAYSYETSNILSFIHLTISNDYTYGDVFNGETGELFNCRTQDDAFVTQRYEQYIRNTLVVKYSEYSYLVNLQEVLGWDNLVRIPEEFNTYLLQYNDVVLSDQYFVKIEYEHSEYPYFGADSPFTDDLLSLAIFGLQTPYNTDYFTDKFELGTTQFEQALIDHELNKDYSDNYTAFMTLINKFKEQE